MNQRIACYTLFDITQTNVLNRSKPNVDDPKEWIKQRNSQANLDTILQCLGLRSQPELVIYPHLIDHTDEPAEFGFLYTGLKYWYWKFEFNTQHANVYDTDDNLLGLLINDCHEVPMLLCDTESIENLPSFLDTTPELRNIYFEIVI